MSIISNYDKSFVCDKYKYLLKYYCYNNSNKLCNKLSYKKMVIVMIAIITIQIITICSMQMNN